MYNLKRILPVLFTRVGWRQPTQAEYAILTEPNTISKSNRYFEDVYSAVSIRNIKDLQEDPDISDESFNLFLENLQKAAILDVLSAVFSKQNNIDTTQLFDPEDDEEPELIENEEKFVGVKVYIAKTTDFVAAVTGVYLYFDKDTSFELKCFVDNKTQAIWAKPVTATGGEMTYIPIDDLVLGYLTDKTRTSTFYIGYFQDEIGEAKAYDEENDGYNAGYIWRAESIQSKRNGNKFNTPTDSATETWGMNLEFTSYRDMTTEIVANAPSFDEAVSLQMACKVLELILSSTRSNLTERISKELLGDIYRELNQETATQEKPYAPGIKARYKGAILELNKSFFGVPKIESHSLPYAVYAE